MSDGREERTTSPRLGWALAIVATFAAVASWLREPAPSAPEEAVIAAGASDGGAADGMEAELEALRACSSALLSCRDERPASGAREESDALQCLASPEVRDEITRAVERACGDRGGARRAAHETALRARARAASAFLQRELAIDDAEQAQLSRYLCAARDLRGLLARASADGGVPDAYEAVRHERELVLADVERVLGQERYSRLRAIGGLAVLGDAVDCEEP